MNLVWQSMEDNLQEVFQIKYLDEDKPITHIDPKLCIFEEISSFLHYYFFIFSIILDV